MSIPALRAIRRIHEDWHIAILAVPWVADLYAGETFCDEILLYRKDREHRGLIGRERLARNLRTRGFDRAILLQNAFDAAWLTWRSGIPERIGFDRDGRGLLLTERVRRPEAGKIPAHQRFYYLELLRRAGLIASLPTAADTYLERTPELRERGLAQWARRGLPSRAWIGVSPGAAFGSAKRWLPDRFASAARALALEMDARIAVFGSQSEAALASEVVALAGDRARSLAGETTLAEYLELAATCRAYITNDSGSMHVAAALGLPTVAIFGATDVEATGPAASWARVVSEPVECSPCLLRECVVPGHPCMTGVSAERVVTAARSLIGQVDQGIRERFVE